MGFFSALFGDGTDDLRASCDAARKRMLKMSKPVQAEIDEFNEIMDYNNNWEYNFIRKNLPALLKEGFPIPQHLVDFYRAAEPSSDNYMSDLDYIERMYAQLDRLSTAAELEKYKRECGYAIELMEDIHDFLQDIPRVIGTEQKVLDKIDKFKIPMEPSIQLAFMLFMKELLTEAPFDDENNDEFVINQKYYDTVEAMISLFDIANRVDIANSHMVQADVRMTENIEELNTALPALRRRKIRILDKYGAKFLSPNYKKPKIWDKLWVRDEYAKRTFRSFDAYANIDEVKEYGEKCDGISVILLALAQQIDDALEVLSEEKDLLDEIEKKAPLFDAKDGKQILSLVEKLLTEPLFSDKQEFSEDYPEIVEQLYELMD